MFVTQEGNVLVNEIAPRPHNSGHQTIEANGTSQYEQHLARDFGLATGRYKFDLAKCNGKSTGEPGFEGLAQYVGIDEIMRLPGVHIHLYGKRLTKPFRKMGHVTIVDDDIEQLKKKANFVKQTLKVTA